jgi:hypothetical protein
MWLNAEPCFAVGAWAEGGGEPFAHTATGRDRPANACRDRARYGRLRAIEEVVRED